MVTTISPDLHLDKEYEIVAGQLEGKTVQVLAEAKTFSQDEQRPLRDPLDRWLRQERPAEGLEAVLHDMEP
jgi:hypothetical protein